LLKFTVETHEATQESLVFVESTFDPDKKALLAAFANLAAAQELSKFFNQLVLMQRSLSYPGKQADHLNTIVSYAKA
jgi:hypothetical protein